MLLDKIEYVQLFKWYLVFSYIVLFVYFLELFVPGYLATTISIIIIYTNTQNKNFYSLLKNGDYSPVLKFNILLQ